MIFTRLVIGLAIGALCSIYGASLSTTLMLLICVGIALFPVKQ